MSHPRLRYLVCYDIAHPKRLRRVARTLESFGTRLQYSVFECPLDQLRLEKQPSGRSSTTTTTKFYSYHSAPPPEMRRSSLSHSDSLTRFAVG